MRSTVVLLTGTPGIGKTTIVRDVVTSAIECCGGFYTLAVSDGKGRTGFEIVTLDGKRALLAEKNGDPNAPRIGSYRVNIESIDKFAVPAMAKAAADGKIVVVDEIGPMEALSSAFRSSVKDVLDDTGVAVFGTIVQRACDFADEIKAHPRVRLIRITRANRNRWLEPLRRLLEL